MLINITGHTSGLGHFLYQHFVNSGCICKGYSKTTGYDINYDYEKIANESLDCDLFINNAPGLGQLYLLKSLNGKCRNIVSIGSSSAKYYPLKKSVYTGEKLQYAKQKYELMLLHHTCVEQHQSNLLLISTASLENHPTESPDKTIKFDTILNCIKFWLSNKQITLIDLDSKIIL